MGRDLRHYPLLGAGDQFCEAEEAHQDAVVYQTRASWRRHDAVTAGVSTCRHENLKTNERGPKAKS